MLADATSVRSKMKFVLKIKVNAGGNKRILYYQKQIKKPRLCSVLL